MFRGATALLCMLLAGCSRDVSLDYTDVPVSKERLAQALDGFNKLRNVFNSGACQALYESFGSAFRSYPRNDWLIDCAHLPRTLGVWHDFQAEEAMYCGAHWRIICVNGLAHFANADRGVESVWLVRNGRVELLNLTLIGGGERIGTAPPGVDGEDPPMPKRKLNKQAKAGLLKNSSTG